MHISLKILHILNGKKHQNIISIIHLLSSEQVFRLHQAIIVTIKIANSLQTHCNTAQNTKNKDNNFGVNILDHNYKQKYLFIKIDLIIVLKNKTSFNNFLVPSW